mmetsp:Transcript_5417/g.11974  ORF Transcript_5417/g.11974 Transcript_5417/m.11974 type:complete len:92 (+) Transcript_5417:324-599(+)
MVRHDNTLSVMIITRRSTQGLMCPAPPSMPHQRRGSAPDAVQVTTDYFLMLMFGKVAWCNVAAYSYIVGTEGSALCGVATRVPGGPTPRCC